MPEIIDREVLSDVADVVLTTTNEIAVITSPPIVLPGENSLISIRAFAQVTIGVAGTLLTPRIRRGAGIAGALVGEATGLTVAAANILGIDHFVSEQRTGPDQVVYSFTLQQAGATGNGTVHQVGIELVVSLVRETITPR